MISSRLFVTLVAALTLIGCGSDPGFDEETDFIRKEGGVQFVNMIPDSPELTMFHGLNNQRIRFPFTTGGEVSFEDRYDWRLAYRDSNLDEITVAEGKNQQITENTLSTFLFMGSLAQPSIEIVDVALPPFADRTEGSAVLWFAANLSSVSMVDLYLLDSDATLAASAPLASLTSGSFTTTFIVDSGENLQLVITVAGSQDILFDSGPITLPDRSVDLFALVDDFGPGGENHIDVIRGTSSNRSIMPDVSQATMSRTSNFSSLNDLTVMFGERSSPVRDPENQTPYSETAGGDQVINISQNTSTIFEDSADLFAGGFHSFLIFDGPDSDTPVAPILVRDEYREISDRVYFQFINGSSETIDFYALTRDQETDDTAPVLNDAQSLASGINEVPTGDTRFIVQTADNEETLGSAQLNLESGTTYTLVYDSNNGLSALEN